MVPNISFPICTAFKPTILEGQLCYKLHVNSSSGQGMKNGLSLLLDYQDELSLQAFPHPKEEKSKKVIKNLNFDTDRNIHREVAKVHINTLSSFVGFGGGSYQMTVVKRMTATDDFIRMPLKERNCEVELYENCRARKLLEECNCIPLEMQWEKVSLCIVHTFLHSHYNFCRNTRIVTQGAEIALKRIMPKLSTAM